VNRDQFVRASRVYCRGHDLPAPRFDAARGKGGHGRIYVGARFTTIRSGEIGRALHRAILEQLGLPKDAFLP
jgi:hypothetical protein